MWSLVAGTTSQSSETSTCSLSRPARATRSPARSRTCLNRDLTTASPSYLGGSSLFVEGEISIMRKAAFTQLTPAFRGQLANTVGPSFTLWGNHKYNMWEKKKHIFASGRVDPFTQHGRQLHTQTPWYYLAEGTAQPILLQKYCHLVARVSLLLLKDIL